MYLVRVSQSGVNYLVLTDTDPQADGGPAPAAAGVTIDYDRERIGGWGAGRTRPSLCVGRSPDDPTQYKVFRDRSELTAAGFELVPGTPVWVRRWAEFEARGGPTT